MDGILSKIRRFMSDNCMSDPGDRIVLGVSGGADSMCLLFALWEIFAKEDPCRNLLQVIHVEHGIRGEASYEDAAFVKSVCDSLKVPCKIVSVDCPKLAKEKGMSLEEAGRDARYEAFCGSDGDCIAVAHHMDDQAETVLANLLRGSALRGIRGMDPVSEYKGKKLIRPLLGITRDEIEQFLTERKITWREDASNEDTSFSRNRIRRNIMPQAKLVNSGAVRHICGTADYIGELEEYLKAETERAYDACLVTPNDGKGGIKIAFDVNAVLNLPPFLAGEVFLKALSEINGGVKDIGAVHLKDLQSLCGKQSGRSVDLPYGIRAVRSSDRLILEKGRAANTPELPKYSVRILENTAPVSEADIPNEIYTKWFDYDKIHGEISLRRRKTGDVIHLSCGRKKLQDYMVNEKIPQMERDSVPILADEESVLWVVGHRISQEHKVTRDTRRILEVAILQDTERCESV